MRFLRWGLVALLLSLFGVLLLGSGPSTAAPTCTKTFLPGTGAWKTAANWAPAGVPTAADYACIPSGRTASLIGPATVDGVRIPGALGGTGTLVIQDAGAASPSELDGTVTGASLTVASGSLAVDSAVMDGAGTTTVAAGASMSVSNPDYYGLILSDARSVVNNGTVELVESAGSSWPSLLLNGVDTSVTNNGLLELTEGADVEGQGRFVVPAGGLVRSVTAGASSIVSTVVELGGRVEPTAGTLVLESVQPPAAGGTTGVLGADGGSLLLQTVSVPAGSTLSTDGVGVTLEGQLQGAGQFTVGAGSLAVDTAAMDGAGTTTVAAGASMSVSNPGYYGLILSDTRSLVNNGTVGLVESAGSSWPSLLLNAVDTSVTNNGVLELAGGADVQGQGVLLNTAAGTITKPTGTQLSEVTAPTDNFGTVRSLVGLLDFSGAFPAISGTTLSRGSYEMVSPGRIKLPSDIVRDDATILLDGPNAVLQDTAAVNGLGNLTRVGPTGSLTLRNGRAQSVGALTQQGAVVIGPGAGSTLTAPNLTQTSGSTSLLSGDSALQTTGVTAIQGGVLRGIGTVTAGGATGVNVTADGSLEPGLAGPGQLSVSGKLTLGAGGTLAVDVDGTAASAHDRVAVTGTAVTGGRIDIDTGYTPALGDTETVLTSGGTRTGSFTSAGGADLPGDISWGATYAPNSVTLRASRPSLTVADASAVEGHAGITQMVFTLTQDTSLLTTSSVTAATADGSATAGGPTYGGSDYVAQSGSATIPFGATSTTVSVPVNGDVVYEHDDSFTLNLTAPDNLVIGDAAATGTIQNDEAVPVLTLGPASVIERDPTDTQAVMRAQATLSGISAYTTSADWSTSEGSASASDFTASGARVSFAPGTTERNLLVPIIGDLLTEADESFGIGFANAAPAGDVILGGAGTATIRDDDAAVSVSPATTTEPPIGTAPLTATVTLSHANPRPVTFSWSTSDGTAVSPGDYVAVAPTTVTIPAGETSRSVTVTVNSDNAGPEGEETFSIGLSSVVGGQPGTTTSPMTILPDRCTIVGTNAAETLIGTAGDDVICGLGGNDTIKPGAGADEVYGGYVSSPGADGVDTLSYDDLGCGVEVDLRSGYATDAGTTACIGTQHDVIAGIENVTGTTGDDTLRGTFGTNVIRGGEGDDSLLGDAGDDTLVGGPGVDFASYVRGVTAGGTVTGVSVDLALTTPQNTDGGGEDTLNSVEGLFGTTLNDRLFGNGLPNTLSGLEGNDRIEGRGGFDIIFGLVGADVIHGGDGSDSLHGGDGVDFVHGEGGPNDRVWGGGGVETATHLTGGAGLGDTCNQGNSDAPQAFVAGSGCEN